MSFISSASTLNIGDGSSNIVNITQATTLNLGKTGGSAVFNVVPTSIATQPASTDSSTKIPTTAWVQSAITYYNTTYTSFYDLPGTILIPSNCRSIDIVLCGAGGVAGMTDNAANGYGGSGSGGNTISANGLPMSDGSLNLTFSTISGTGATTLTRNGVILASAYNGNAGSPFFESTGGGDGASTNSTMGIGDTSFGSFYNTFGSAGVTAGYYNGGNPPNMTGGAGCPKGSGTWINGGYGMGQQTTFTFPGPGYCLITYHIGIP